MPDSASGDSPVPGQANVPAVIPQEPTPETPTGPSPIERLINSIRHALGLKTEVSLRENIADALQADESADAIDEMSPEERAMLRNILGLHERRVDDVMVPRADILAVEAQIPLADLLLLFREAGHSRMPVYRETLDDTIGMVHIKDLVNWITSNATMTKAAAAKRKTPRPGNLDLGKINLGRTLSSTKLVRKVLFVPPSMPTLDLLAQMQATRIHMAVVIDEYGGTDGLVTIEDLMEEIVGDIEDEHDVEDDVVIRTLPDGSAVVDARAEIEDVGALFDVDLAADEAAEEIDTIGGFVFSLLGRVPVRGELVPYGDGVEMEVLDADPRRIKRVRIYRRSVNGNSRAAEAAPALSAEPSQDTAAPERLKSPSESVTAKPDTTTIA